MQNSPATELISLLSQKVVDNAVSSFEWHLVMHLRKSLKEIDKNLPCCQHSMYFIKLLPNVPQWDGHLLIGDIEVNECHLIS